jgi:hypothetical protein
MRSALEAIMAQFAGIQIEISLVVMQFLIQFPCFNLRIFLLTFLFILFAGSNQNFPDTSTTSRPD